MATCPKCTSETFCLDDDGAGASVVTRVWWVCDDCGHTWEAGAEDIEWRPRSRLPYRPVTVHVSADPNMSPETAEALTTLIGAAIDAIEEGEFDDDDWREPDYTCEHCHGTGVHWDGPGCPYCDDMGYYWWLP